MASPVPAAPPPPLGGGASAVVPTTEAVEARVAAFAATVEAFERARASLAAAVAAEGGGPVPGSHTTALGRAPVTSALVPVWSPAVAGRYRRERRAVLRAQHPSAATMG